MSVVLNQLLPSNGYDVAIVPVLIGVIGAIGGAALGAASNNKNFSQNQMNNEFNAREAQKARDFQLEMWNKQNEYNYPTNQRSLRAEAGYNPSEYASVETVTVVEDVYQDDGAPSLRQSALRAAGKSPLRFRTSD